MVRTHRRHFALVVARQTARASLNHVGNSCRLCGQRGLVTGQARFGSSALMDCRRRLKRPLPVTGQAVTRSLRHVWNSRHLSNARRPVTRRTQL